MQNKAVKCLNTSYMRVLRCIADDVRYKGPVQHDVEIRLLLGAPSIECVFRVNRLLYMSRLARNSPQALKALLQNGAKNCLPWVTLIQGDLQALYNSNPSKFEHMPSPDVNPES